MRVAELSREFGVSAVTVRSDLDALEAGGGIRRIRGGAMPSDAARLRELYPRFGDFVRIRDEVDPDGRFTNPYLDRVLGPGLGPPAGRPAAGPG